MLFATLSSTTEQTSVVTVESGPAVLGARRIGCTAHWVHCALGAPAYWVHCALGAPGIGRTAGPLSWPGTQRNDYTGWGPILPGVENRVENRVEKK